MLRSLTYCLTCCTLCILGAIMVKTCYRLYKATEYQKWFDEETHKSQAQIADRLSKIEQEGHFGIHKFLEDGVWELKWLNGRRVYYAHLPELNIFLLLGGNKNGQNKDINNAKKVLKKYHSK